MISGVSKVIVAVDHQERAKAFWTDQVGFETARDDGHGLGQWS